MLLFFTAALAASLTDEEMSLAGYTTETTWHSGRGRSLPTLTVAYVAALTAGTVSVQLQKNGADIGDPATLSTDQHLATIAPGDSLHPGSRLSALVTTSADLAPTGQPLVALIP